MIIDRASGRTRAVILGLHLVALLAGLLYAWGQWADVAAQHGLVVQSRETLDQLNARFAAARGRVERQAAASAADPFVPGASITIAGAALQDRVVSAIRAAGGTVTSSQIDTTGAASTPPSLSLTVNCTLAHAALQGLLYTLEANTPALFVDQLSIEAAAPESGTDGPGDTRTLTIAMTVSAYWNGGGKS